MPQNFIAFELPSGKPEWWWNILEGVDAYEVTDSHIAVNDNPGLGISFRIDEAKRYLREEDQDFFD